MANCPFVEPFKKSTPIENAKIFNLNYTNQDFWSMKARLLDFIKEKFGDRFTNFVESDIAVMLTENWAFLADTLSFKIDQLANELFIDSVTEIENAFRLAKLVGFQPTPPIAARSMWSATLQSPLVTDIYLPSPMEVDISTDEGTSTIELFPADADKNPVLDEDIIIPAGNLFNTSIVGVEGRTTTDNFEGDGSVGQSYTLATSPVLWQSVRVFVDGVEWEEVDYFTDSQPRREFRVEFTSSYQAFVIFGNNRAGLIPSRGSQIRITYRTGGGIVGNITSGFVTTQRTVNVPGLDFSVPVTLRNYTKGEFGYAGDTIEDVRRKLPRWVRTQDRAVSGLDYKTLADLFATAYQGQIGKSNAILRQHGCAGNVIDLYVLALDGEDGLKIANSGLKTALQAEINAKKMLTDYVCIRDGKIITTDVSIEVTLDRFFRKFEDEIKERIISRVNTFFKLPNWEYNKTLKDTNLIKELSDIREVQEYSITFTTEDADNSGSVVSAGFSEIIRPDTTTISFMYS